MSFSPPQPTATIAPPTRTEWLTLIAILTTAGLLRMLAPGLTEFKADEARLLALALDMADFQTFALRGIGSSVGFPNFPMSVWLYSLPLLIWPHPYAATLFTGLLNTAAVALTWWLVRRYWGPTAALAAALMFAVSPWAIIFSRKIWAQNLLPLFVTGWAAGALLAYVDRRPRWLVLHILCGAIAIQTHLAAVALLPASIVMLLRFWRRVDWRWLAAGVGLAALTGLPFALYLATQANLDSGAAGAAVSTVTPVFDFDSLRYSVLINLGQEIHSLAGPEAFQAYLARVPNLQVVHLLWLALIVAGLGRFGYLAAGARPTTTLSTDPRIAADAGFIVLVWALAPPLTFLYHATPVFPHYFIPTYPAAYIAAGVAFALILHWLTTSLPPQLNPSILPNLSAALPPIAWVSLVATAVLQTWVWIVLLGFITTQVTPGAFGLPLRHQLAAIDRARVAMNATGATEILVAAEGEFPSIDEGPAIYDTLLRAIPHRFVDARRSAVFPPAPTVVLVLDPASPAADLYRAHALTVTRVPGRRGEPPQSVLTLPPANAIAPTTAPTFFANGVALVDHTAQRDHNTIDWQLTWYTGTPDPAATYTWFNHLYDATGQRIAQQDVATFSAHQWRPGDLVFSRFTLEIPPQAQPPFSMRTGLYRFPELENVPVLDAAANPAADAAEFNEIITPGP